MACGTSPPGTHNLRFSRGATHLVVGPSASGKTFRTCSILEARGEIIEGGEEIRNVVLCYAAWQPVYQALRDKAIVTRFVNKKPSADEFVELVGPYRDKGGSVVVIDDFMGQIDQDLVDIVTVHSRHYNTSTFILFQSLFPPNKLARQISLNVKYLHCHKNPRENAQIGVLARQIAPGDGGWIVEAYHKITSEPHQCMLLDLTQQCRESFRVRSHYLPHELPMRVWFSAKSIPI